MALFSGPSFQVAADMACFAKGTRLTLLSYPNAMDEELSTENMTSAWCARCETFNALHVVCR